MVAAPRRWRSGASTWRGLGLRFGVPLAFLFAVATNLAVPHVDRVLMEWFRADVELRSRLVANSVEEGVLPLLEEKLEGRGRAYLNKVAADERLFGILICRADGSTAFQSDRSPLEVACVPSMSEAAKSTDFDVVVDKQGLLHVGRFGVEDRGGHQLVIVVVHDSSFIDRRRSRLRD